MRILAFLENDMYVRNFATSGAFASLLERPDFGVSLSEHVTVLKDKVPSGKLVESYERDGGNIRLVYQLNKLSLLALREKSSTFAMKADTGWMGQYSPDERMLAAVKPFEMFKGLWASRIQNNVSLEAVIEKHKPDLAIFPFTGVEATGAELVMLSRKHGFKTLFLVNGWDNLCSKGVFPLLPDFLGLWGPASLEHAVNIQGIKAHRCALMGCARYEPYFASMMTICGKYGCETIKSWPTAHDRPYILFLGASKPGDELTPLRVMDDVVHETGWKGEIVYRPHPWREERNCDDHYMPDKFRHVRMDPQVADAYYDNKTAGQESVSATQMPQLDYYPKLLANARFVVSMPTSMMLEAALFDAPCIIVAHDDGAHPIPPSAQLREAHFAGACEVPGWFIAGDLLNLSGKFGMMLERFGDEGGGSREYAPVLSNAMRRYLYWDERSYAERLNDAAEMILAT